MRALSIQVVDIDSSIRLEMIQLKLGELDLDLLEKWLAACYLCFCSFCSSYQWCSQVRIDRLYIINLNFYNYQWLFSLFPTYTLLVPVPMLCQLYKFLLVFVLSSLYPSQIELLSGLCVMIEKKILCMGFTGFLVESLTRVIIKTNALHFIMAYSSWRQECELPRQLKGHFKLRINKGFNRGKS